MVKPYCIANRAGEIIRYNNCPSKPFICCHLLMSSFLRIYDDLLTIITSNSLSIQYGRLTLGFWSITLHTQLLLNGKPTIYRVETELGGQSLNWPWPDRACYDKHSLAIIVRHSVACNLSACISYSWSMVFRPTVRSVPFKQ